MHALAGSSESTGILQKKEGEEAVDHVVGDVVERHSEGCGNGEVLAPLRKSDNGGARTSHDRLDSSDTIARHWHM
jgi:hypothetical protein